MATRKLTRPLDPSELDDALENPRHEIFNVVALLLGASSTTESVELDTRDKNENVRRVLRVALERLGSMDRSMQPLLMGAA